MVGEIGKSCAKGGEFTECGGECEGTCPLARVMKQKAESKLGGMRRLAVVCFGISVASHLWNGLCRTYLCFYYGGICMGNEQCMYSSIL